MSLTPEERQIALQQIEFLQASLERTERKKFFQYYPDEGPLRRELYAKHMAFFAAGFTHRERCMMAGNRVGKCISGDTLIESPDRSARYVDEIKGDHWVYAWDGEKKVPAKAEKPFKKPPEKIYRVWLRSGLYVDCAAEHRILGVAGWLFLSDLFGCVPCLPLSTEGFGRVSSAQDVARYLSTVPGSQGGYPAGHYLSDEQLRSVADNDPTIFRSPADVRRHILALLHGDGRVGRDKRILSQHDVLLSSLCEVDPTEGLFARFVSQIPDSAGQPYQPRHLTTSLWRDGSVSRSQSRSEDWFRRSVACAIVSPRRGVDFIIGYQELGVQDIWDFHVPDFHNYVTGGMVHHNTEGAGGYEVTAHLTGLYPHWWIGRRFSRPVNVLVAGDTGTTTRDIIQTKLCGPVSKLGTGIIPFESLGETSAKAGIPGAFDIVSVKHEPSGEWSTLQFRSYDQGRIAFQGTERDVIWCDEEPPRDVYDECLIRTMTTNGIVICTFTPMLGLSEVAMAFLPHLGPVGG